jgi:signal peptidase I
MMKTPTPTINEKAERPATTSSSDWSRTIRETVESVAIAFALAFLFKTFEAEAFVIPTGSMAPTLMGRHKDVICPECGYRYSASGSDEADHDGNIKRRSDGAIDTQAQVVACTCPICRYTMPVDPLDPEAVGRKANPSYSGDRIWVSKVPYQLMEPRRWDVIVFRFPEEAETYYIKRLIGLPNETVKIFHGDIYTKGVGDADFVIQRKPPDKVRAMAQVVHDNDFVSPALVKHDWPPRWQTRSDEAGPGAWQMSDDERSYDADGTAAGETWIRYEHLVPSDGDWRAMDEGRWSPGQRPRPQLITDFYAFNTRVLRGEYGPAASMLGLHWVGDLMVDCALDVRSDSGTVLLDLVKGGRHFRCDFDVASGTAELSIDGLDDWRRTAQTSVRGAGKHRVMFANIDRQLMLWVDDKVVAFDEPATYDDLDNDHPQASQRDGGDLAPVGIGSRGAALHLDHLRVLRDIYYIADDRSFMSPITDYHGGGPPMQRSDELVEFLSTPERWQSRRGGNVFDQREKVDFELIADQFFVLGDNSPASSDARLWRRQHYVERDLLVGKALFVYWPHPLNLYIPMTDVSIPIIPNFPGMGFIR